MKLLMGRTFFGKLNHLVNWKVVPCLQEDGWLNVRSLKLKNLALPFQMGM